MQFWGATKNAATAKPKRSAGLHISLHDLCLTARIIWRRPAHSCCLSLKRVLHLTAWPTVQHPTQLSMSLPASTVAWGEGGQKAYSSPILLTDCFYLLEASVFPPLLRACGRENEDKGNAHMEVWVKINTPELSWTEFHPNCRADSRSILMHPRPPQNTDDNYYNSTLCDSPKPIEQVWKIAPREQLPVVQKCLERW